MAQFSRTPVAMKHSLEEASKNWSNLPSILSMRLYEWIAALTHPKTGAFPNGISPRQLDRLAQNQIEQSSKEMRQELKPIWKSNNHLGVILWNEVKAGRVIRLHKACYVGNFQNKHIKPKPVPEVAPSQQPKEESQCFVCKHDLDNIGSNGTLKCVECACQTHVLCAYSSGPIPVNLLKRAPAAIGNWRCYDCKRCHLCGKKDDPGDGLLLCDGCDSGEHMGCQRPLLNEVPPAPWFCSLCHPPSTPPVLQPETTEIDSNMTNQESQEDTTAPYLVVDEQIDVEEEEAKKADSPIRVMDTVPSPDFPSNRSETDIMKGQSHTTTSPPAWPTTTKPASPPFSDDMPEVQARRGSDTSNSSSIPGTVVESPLRTRLGKRDSDGQWVIEDSSSPPHRRRHYKRASSSINIDLPNKIARSESASSRDNDNAKFEFGSRKSRKSKDEIELLPYMSEDLPLLNEDDARNVRGAKIWTVDDTAAFLDKMGYHDSAKAFKREEIDGAALLLLRRQDVLLNLGLKLGPALKTYKFIRYIQSTVRSA